MAHHYSEYYDDILNDLCENCGQDTPYSNEIRDFQCCYDCLEACSFCESGLKEPWEQLCIECVVRNYCHRCSQPLDAYSDDSEVEEVVDEHGRLIERICSDCM